MPPSGHVDTPQAPAGGAGGHAGACPICAAPIAGSSGCVTSVCSAPDRAIERVAAIGPFDGPLKQAIKELKYGGDHQRAAQLGQLIRDWLDHHLQPGDIDLIVPNPTWSGPGAPDRRHTELVITAAAELDGRWPFDHEPWTLTKPHPTPTSAGKSWLEKRAIAKLHAASVSIDTHRVRGRRILVYDDVATTLFTQEYLARRLLDAGASSVLGLVAARAAPLPAPTPERDHPTRPPVGAATALCI